MTGDGIHPRIALDLEFLAFRGKHGDARIAAVICQTAEGYKYYLAINDTDREEKRVKSHRIDENEGLRLSVKQTEYPERFLVARRIHTPQALARYLHCEACNKSIHFGLATGVGIIEQGGGFSFGVYNSPVKEIGRWVESLQK
ncbi:hypothetical protein KKD19_00230 [Patescibacteria group bacterium]|nr:hypothetical protein [Patescibacteria group bacterium]MCG2692745.1 hypothetical protein [Candidatus Parcubacteria bacterium]